MVAVLGSTSESTKEHQEREAKKNQDDENKK